MSNGDSVGDYEECSACGEEVTDFWVCGDGEVLCAECAEPADVASPRKCSHCFEDKTVAELRDDLGGRCAACVVLANSEAGAETGDNWWAVLPLGAVLVSLSPTSGVAVFHAEDPEDCSRLIAYTVDLWTDWCTQSVAVNQNSEV